MFVQKSKRRIEISSVSLVDVKAEISRRQIEVKRRAKVLPNGSTVITGQLDPGHSRSALFKPPPKVAKLSPRPEQPEEDEVKRLEWARMRRSLEAKTRLYDALKGAALANRPARFGEADDNVAPLVDFERKAMESEAARREEGLSPSLYHGEDDCSGEEVEECALNAYSEPPVSIPDGPITYAHLRQGEVRDHGVGFYAFSADAQQRSAELASLRELRRATEAGRSHAEAVRARRDIQVAQRLARLRARKGLPDLATAAARCLEAGLAAAPPASEEAAGAGTPDGAAAELMPSSDDLDIASMLRRLRDESELRTAAQDTANRASDTASAVAAAVTRLVSSPTPGRQRSKRQQREWDRGKSMVPADSYVRWERERRDAEFAPPAMYR